MDEVINAPNTPVFTSMIEETTVAMTVLPFGDPTHSESDNHLELILRRDDQDRDRHLVTLKWVRGAAIADLLVNEPMTHEEGLIKAGEVAQSNAIESIYVQVVENRHGERRGRRVA